MILAPDLTATPIEGFAMDGLLTVASDGVDFLVAGVRRTQTTDTLVWQRVLRDGRTRARGEAPVGPRFDSLLQLHLFWTGETYLSLVVR